MKDFLQIIGSIFLAWIIMAVVVGVAISPVLLFLWSIGFIG